MVCALLSSPLNARPSSAKWMGLILADVQLSMIPMIEEVYSRLRDWYPEDARLCHGDCGGANMLIQNARVAALVDWEWASGGDPAADIAYWSFWHEDAQVLEYLLAAYQPSDVPGFRQRIGAYYVVHAVHLLAVFSASGDTWSMRSCREKLEEYLRSGT